MNKYFSAAVLALLTQAAFAQTAPTLGTASSFAALGGTGVTCTSPPVIPAITVTGNVGSLSLVPTTVTGFPGFPGALPCTLSGTVQLGAAAAHDALFGTNGAYNALAAQACNFNHADTEQLSGQSLQSGVHCFPSTALLNGPLPLNLVGNGPWIIRLGSALTTGATSPAMATVLVNGQANCGTGVFWQLGTATIGANTAFVGNILATTAISFTGTNSSLLGRAFANTASVTMTGASINNSCGAQPPVPPVACKDKDKKHHEGKKHQKGKKHGEDRQAQKGRDGHDRDDDDHDDHDDHDDDDCDRSDDHKNPFGKHGDDGKKRD